MVKGPVRTIRRLARAVYTRSLQQWVWGTTDRLYASVSKISARGWRAKITGAGYRSERDRMIRGLLSKIAAGEPASAVLSGFDARRWDERVLEYAVVAEWLAGQPAGQDLLDVGCVMNNHLVADLLEERCQNVWFVNIVLEPVLIKNPVLYHLQELDQALPLGPQFGIVTCLSTIEHIGFDNRHYGIRTPARRSTVSDEPLIQALRKLGKLLAAGGQLLVTVPFGVREVILHPRTGRAAQQVFDAASLQVGVETLRRSGVVATAEVWEATTSGWQRASPEGCARRYADGCPAAAAVAVFRAAMATGI